MLHTKFHGHRLLGSREEDFKGSYLIWSWWLTWSCDLNHLNKLSFPHPKETPQKMASISRVLIEDKSF